MKIDKIVNTTPETEYATLDKATQKRLVELCQHCEAYITALNSFKEGRVESAEVMTAIADLAAHSDASVDVL